MKKEELGGVNYKTGTANATEILCCKLYVLDKLAALHSYKNTDKICKQQQMDALNLTNHM